MVRGCVPLLTVLAGLGACWPGRPDQGTSATIAHESAPQSPAWGPAPTAAPQDVERRLLDAELARDLHAPAIRDALAADASTRRRAVNALAHIGGPAALLRVADLLERDGEAANWVALALLDPPRGAPGAAPEPEGDWARIEDALWSRYAVLEGDVPEQVESLLLGIARLGGSRSIDRLAADLSRPPVGDGHVRYTNAMRALAILCARGYSLTETARDAVAAGLDTPEPASRRAAIYALGRCARPSSEVLALANEREVIVARLARLLEHANDEEQRLLWRAYAAVGELPTAVPTSILGDEPPGWQAEVEAVRALVASAAGRELAVQRLSRLDVSTILGARHHVLLELLHGLRSVIADEPALVAWLPKMLAAIDAAAVDATPRERHPLALARCEIALLSSIASGEFDAVRGCTPADTTLPDGYAEALVVEALLHMGDAMTREQRIESLLRLAQDSRPGTAIPALTALTEIEDRRADTVLRAALDRLDVGVVSAAAAAVAARSVDASKRDSEAVPALTRTIRRLSNADAVEARIAAIEALGSLGRAPKPDVVETPDAASTPIAPDAWLADVILPLRVDPNASVRRAARDALLDHDALLSEFDANTRPIGGDFGEHLAAAAQRVLDERVTGLRFRTTAGDFSIDFRGAPAPINQANLVDLAARGFYDGLRWHRVVPGFVVQGGDPRGDGYGGPGHLVPCEWSNLRYERGTVGIALAGKDTGGSQLFITHSEQPHLDARYTVIGRVVQGMEVVDQLMPGDRIETVTLVEDQR